MARTHDDAEPQHPLIEGGGPATTEERVIGSLLEGLDAPQPVVRTRTGRRVNASEPPPAAAGDRQAPTALLPAGESRQKRRATYIAAALGIFAIVLAIAYARRSATDGAASNGDGQAGVKNANVAAVLPVPTAPDFSTNHQMNTQGSAAPLAPSQAPTAPMPTVSLSSLPSAPTAPERPHPTTRPAVSSGTGNHAEIREDQL